MESQRPQGGPGNNWLSKIECILGTWTSQNASRDQRHACTGIHCLRHSYALHLLRQGTSLKTIGDLLGHRTAESTCVYLRLAIEDLREVALDVPGRCRSSQHSEVQP